MAVVLEQSHGDRKVEIGVSRARAELEAMSGRFRAARELLAHAKALARELGDQVALAAVFRDAGHVETLAGDPVAAEALDRAGFDILERISDHGHLASAAPDLGDAMYAQGRYDEAAAIAEFAERLTIEGDVDAQVRGTQLRAKVLARRGRFEEALAALGGGRASGRRDRLPRAPRPRAHEPGRGAPARRPTRAMRRRRSGTRSSCYRRKGNVVEEARATALLEELGS